MMPLQSHDPINLTQYLLEKTKDKKRVAFFCEEKKVTYSELEQLIQTMSYHFQALGLCPGQRVIILLNDSVELVVAFFATIAIGACPVVLNPLVKLNTLSYILEDTQAIMIFCEYNTLSLIFDAKDKFTECAATYVIVNKNAEDLAKYGDDTIKYGENPSIIPIKKLFHNEKIVWNNYYPARSNEMVFMQYTSGTTGSPKGVMHSGHAVIASAELFAKTHLNVQENDIFYSVPKMFFGFGMGNSLFFPLYFSACAVIDPRWPTTEIIMDNIVRYSPTLLFSAPVTYSDLLKAPSDWCQHSRIRLFFSGGAPLPAKLQLAWEDRFDFKINEGFGITEMCHVFITNAAHNIKSASTGKLVPGYEFRLESCDNNLDSEKNTGIMFVKGPSMALGYWNKPKETLQRFQDGWYKTDDIFFVDEDSCFYFLGRNDDLFKIKGRWVIPSFIENYVEQKFTKVLEAVLVPINKDFSVEGVLFIVGENTKIEWDLNLILTSIKNEFDRYQVPAAVVLLEKMPKQSS